MRALPILLAIAVPVQAGTVAFMQDTLVDGANSYPNDRVEISNGLSGATATTMVSGGTVRGFGVFGSSVFEIKGGSSTFLSDTNDTATLIMRGGEVGCTTAECFLIDYGALLRANDSSTLQVFGGSINGVISLNDQSTAHFYGSGLRLASSGDAITVQGEFDGVTKQFVFNDIPTTAGRIFLHEIPEAPAWLIALSTCFCAAGCAGRVRRNTANLPLA
jgi:hypothetical protein